MLDSVFHAPSTFIFRSYFLNMNTVDPISQPTSNYINLPSFLTIYPKGALWLFFFLSVFVNS